MNVVKKSPIWKQAVDDFMQAEFKPGETLTRVWLMEHFELSEPLTVEEYKRFEIKYMNSLDKFRLRLLEDHCIDIRNIWGSGGYQIVPASLQTRMAMNDAQESLRKMIRTHGRRIRFVDHSQLTDEQRRENADALAKISSLQSMAAPKKWLNCS